jgi:AraC-like DNA-binding protein
MKGPRARASRSGKNAPSPGASHFETFFTFPPEGDLSLQYAGEETCAPGHCWQGIRNHFLIHFVLHGSGDVLSATGTQRLSSGDGFLFFPGQRCWYSADRRQPWTYTWVGFTGRRAAAAVRQAGFSEARTVWHAAPDAALRKLFRQLAQLVPSSPSATSLRQTGLLYLLLDRIGALMRPEPETSERGHTGAIARAFRFIELHYGQDIDVSDIARHAGLERTYFSAFFKRETGRTPAGYLQAYRMARAEHLLTEDGLSVKEIAFSVGYGDYFVFAKRFKKTHSCTPSEFRLGAQSRP